MAKFSNVLLLISLAIFVSGDNEKDLQNLEDQYVKHLDFCVKETKVLGVQIDEIGRFNIPKEIPPMCFLACMAKNFNIMNSSNRFSTTKIKTLLKPVEKKLKTKNMGQNWDKKTEEKDECVAATKGFECIVNNGKKAGIVVSSNILL